MTAGRRRSKKQDVAPGPELPETGPVETETAEEVKEDKIVVPDLKEDEDPWSPRRLFLNWVERLKDGYEAADLTEANYVRRRNFNIEEGKRLAEVEEDADFKAALEAGVQTLEKAPLPEKKEEE